MDIEGSLGELAPPPTIRFKVHTHATFLNRLFMKSFLLLLLGCATTVCPTSLSAAARPNIIFILTDDLGYGDYGVFFQNLRREKNDRSEPWHFTPHIDTLAEEGLQLRNHYCPAPVCAPSRASLLLGVHQGHANVRDNQFDKAIENNHTLATVLKGAGYATAAIGKWGLQGGPPERSAAAERATPDELPGYPTHRGFDDFFGYVSHYDGHFHYPKEDGRHLWHNNDQISDQLDGCYTTDLFTARAKKWIIDQHSSHPQQPFFVYLAYDTPHAKLELPPGPFPAGAGLKGGIQWLGTPGMMINTADGKPDSYIHPDYANATWDHDRNPATPEQPWPNVYQRYATDVRRIENCVGDLMQFLKDLGIDDNTLIVFTTDNGPSRESYLPENYEPTFFNSFGPFDGIKRDCWEGGIRVGALVRWPGGAPANRISNLPCQSHDWMPTFAEFAGVGAPARCDGTSLVPTITGRGVQKTPQVYVEYAHNGKTPAYREFEASRRDRVRKQMQAIRLGDFVGVRYNIKAHSDPFEIYNIVTDPKETTDLAASRPDLQKQMHDAVLEMRRPNASALRPYDHELIPAVPATGAVAGVQWKGYAKAAPWLARLDDLKSQAGGTMSTIEAPAGVQADAFLFSGFLDVPTDGEYTFTLPAGATALLRIHDATVIDRAFAPASSETPEKILLRAGRHPFRLYWQSSKVAPQLEISGPEMKRQPIPASMLFSE